MKKRIAVLVSGGGTNLQALLEAEDAGLIPHGEIALVISNNPDAYALQRARAFGVPAGVITRAECGSQEAFEDTLQAVLERNGTDLIILAGFMSILSEKFTSKWPKRIINVHPSLIPSFCGAGFYGLKVHEAALAYGVKVTGATVHFVNEIPDGGETYSSSCGCGWPPLALPVSHGAKPAAGGSPHRPSHRSKILLPWLPPSIPLLGRLR